MLKFLELFVEQQVAVELIKFIFSGTETCRGLMMPGANCLVVCPLPNSTLAPKNVRKKNI